MKKKIRKAVIPVAGRGTRMLPATKAVPKELLPLVDTPILQLLVEEAVAAGVEEIIFVTAPGKYSIQKYFEADRELERDLRDDGRTDLAEQLRAIRKLAKFYFVTQEEPLGDGHAILQAEELVGDEPFLVLFGDDIVRADTPVAAQLAALHAAIGGAVIALQEVEKEKVSSYGIVAGLRSGDRVAIEDFVEKPTPADAPSNLAIVGKYICPPAIFDLLKKKPSTSGEIRLIDALASLPSETAVTGLIFEGVRYDTGSKAGYVAAFIDYALTHAETHDATLAAMQRLAGVHPKR